MGTGWFGNIVIYMMINIKIDYPYNHIKIYIYFAHLSLSDLTSLNRLRRRNSEPFSNMSRAAGCRAQYAPLPGLSGIRGIFTKQSLNDRLCRSEFCHRCVFRL